MLNALNIVKGAVSAKDLIPVFTHIAVHEGRLHGFDGRVHISAPCPQLSKYSFTVPMIPFVAAIEACLGKPILSFRESEAGGAVTNGYMEVSNAKGFTATMPIGPVDAFPMPNLEGPRRNVKHQLLPILAALQPFIGQDATRPWSASIRFHDGEALATNNVVLLAAKVELQSTFCLPAYAVEELLRLGVEPLAIGITDNAAVFYLPNDVWLRTTLLEDTWPDASTILADAMGGAKWTKLPIGLRQAVEQVKPFCPDPKNPLIKFVGQTNTVSTLDGVIQSSVGGLKGPGIGKGCYHADPLLSVLSVALKVDWSRFPKVPFTGKAGEVPVRGVFLGIPER